MNLRVKLMIAAYVYLALIVVLFIWLERQHKRGLTEIDDTFAIILEKIKKEREEH